MVFHTPTGVAWASARPAAPSRASAISVFFMLVSGVIG
jgi:hypothetical protein